MDVVNKIAFLNIEGKLYIRKDRIDAFKIDPGDALVEVILSCGQTLFLDAVRASDFIEALLKKE